MSRFRFALDPVLRMRERTEQERLAEVAAIEQERARLEADIRAAQRQISAGQTGQRDRLTGDVDLDDLRTTAAATLGAMRRASRLAVELAGTYRRLEEARGRLTEAARDRRAVERLRERRVDAWRTDAARSEAADLDEAAIAAWRRRRAAGSA